MFDKWFLQHVISYMIWAPMMVTVHTSKREIICYSINYMFSYWYWLHFTTPKCFEVWFYVQLLYKHLILLHKQSEVQDLKNLWISVIDKIPITQWMWLWIIPKSWQLGVSLNSESAPNVIQIFLQHFVIMFTIRSSLVSLTLILMCFMIAKWERHNS